MPVLVNKGEVPTLTAWLFYSPRATVAQLRDAIREHGYTSGVVCVDPGQGKPRETVDVHLAVTTEAAPSPADEGDEGAEAARAAEAVQGARGTEDVEQAAEATRAAELTEEQAAELVARAQQAAAAAMPEITPGTAGVDDLTIGLTTRDAAQRYLRPREVDGAPWTLNVPGLPQLADFIDTILAPSGDARWVIWSVDPSGIMRLTPAKDVKVMAGNILRVKL